MDRGPAAPELPPFQGDWGGPESPLANASSVEAGVHWTSAGRRITLTGSASAGLEAAASGPVHVLSEPLLITAGASLQPVSLLATPSDVRRIIRSGSEPAEERWAAALELPVAFRELDLPDTVAFEQTWRIAVTGRTLAARVHPSRRAATVATVATVAAGDDGPRIVLALDRGRLDPAESGDGGAALRIAGRGRVRLMLVTAAGEADLARTLNLVARRGFAGLRAQRLQHERILREYAAALSTPLTSLDSRFEWAKVLVDEQVRSTRSVVQAEALLSVGLRDGARDLLKAGCRTLAASWTAWTGEPPPGGAAAAAPPRPPALDTLPDAPAAAAELPPERLLRWVTGTLWGIVADAPGGAVSLAPGLPSGWTRMALSRIRVGSSAIDCDVRARAGGVVVRVRRASGAPLIVTLAPRGIAPRAISVDGIELAGGRARFEAAGEHEVVFELAP